MDVRVDRRNESCSVDFRSGDRSEQDMMGEARVSW